jgi:DNA-binding SARP family transcriptional activator
LALGNLLGSFFLAWGDASMMDPWIAEFESLLAASGGSIPTEVEPRVLGGCYGILGRRADHPMLPELVERALTLTPALTDASQRYGLAALCARYLLFCGDFNRARSFCTELLAGGRDDTLGWNGIDFGIAWATILWSDGDYEAAESVVRSALGRATRLGLTVGLVHIHMHLAQCAIIKGDFLEARRLLDAGWPGPEPWHSLDRCAFGTLRAITIAFEGDPEQAVPLVTEAHKRLSELGSPINTAFGAMHCGWVLLLAGRHAEAREYFDTTLAFGHQMPSTTLQFQALLPKAWSHFQTGEEHAGLDCLREALPIGRRHDYKSTFPLWLPHVMSELFGRALAAGIEPDYVKRFIRRCGLLPPADRLDQEYWPWPLRVSTLGQFAVQLDDQPLALPARAPKKPLELLKALIALGGRSVSLGTLTHALWPELLGDAATNAFTVALHRLRKLLGEEAALVLTEGKLSLDPQRVWVDAWAFERLVAKLDGMGREKGTAQSADANELAEELLRLYPGHFLAEEEAAWALAPRERLRSKFLRACSGLSAMLESADRAEDAVTLNRRALELDPLAEPLHQHLIKNLHALGRNAEALQAYRRCRELLSITLGVEPSPATQALYPMLKG